MKQSKNANAIPSSEQFDSAPQRVVAPRTTIACAPLAVLLPKLSSVQQLTGYRVDLERRLRELQTQRASCAEEVDRSNAAEESMLSQVLQWLTPEEM